MKRPATVLLLSVCISPEFGAVGVSEIHSRHANTMEIPADHTGSPIMGPWVTWE